MNSAEHSPPPPAAGPIAIACHPIEPAKLIELKRRIQQETPGSKVAIATHAAELLGECDLIVTATSAFGQRVIDITKCKPGAVICDVARPPDINEAGAVSWVSRAVACRQPQRAA